VSAGGEDIDAGIIVAIVLLSIIVDFWQSYRSATGGRSLRASVAPTATCATELVRFADNWSPGTSSGSDRGPHPAVNLWTRDLSVQQSMLAGESLPADKKASADGPPRTGPAPDLVSSALGRQWNGGSHCDRDRARTLLGTSPSDSAAVCRKPSSAAAALQPVVCDDYLWCSSSC
jgi:magnesium-transporting ATPase (P-type)